MQTTLNISPPHSSLYNQLWSKSCIFHQQASELYLTDQHNEVYSVIQYIACRYY